MPKGKKRKKGNARAKRSNLTPMGEEFFTRVLVKLRPENLRIVRKHKLSEHFFSDLCGTVFEIIARTPELKQALVDFQPLAMSYEIRRDMASLLKLDPAGTLERALANGLDVRLAEFEHQSRRAEAAAWETASVCGLVDHYNKTQALSGYDAAVASLDAARLNRLRGKPNTWLNQTRKMRWATTLPTALLEYWLPLGLWALSVEDAIRALRLFALSRRIRNSDDPGLEGYFRSHPHDLEAFQGQCLPAMQPNKRASHTRFAKEVRALRLYRESKPLAKLVQVKPAATATKTAAKIQSAKDAPEQWEIVSVTGEVLPGKW